MKRSTLANPSMSVVIPCHNNACSLEVVLRSLVLQSSVPEEIICVDDSSECRNYQEIASLARSYGAQLFRLPRIRVPVGRRSMARNLGSRVARGEVLLYLDGDMILGPCYVEAIRRIHALDPKAIHVRLPLALVKRIDHLGVEWGTHRAATMEKLLEDALSDLDALERGGGG